VEPLFTYEQETDSSINPNQLAYYVHIVRILGQIDTKSGFIICVAISALYILALICLLLYCIFVSTSEGEVSKILQKRLTLALIAHSRVIFYFIHYFLIVSLENQRTCSDSALDCGHHWTAILIIIVILNFLLAFFKEIFLNKPQKTKDITSANSSLYPFVSLLQKTIIICLLTLSNNSKYAALTLNIITCLTNLYLLLETFPFYNLLILRISIAFNSVALGLSVLLIPEVCGEAKAKYTLFAALAVSSLVLKVSLIRLDWASKSVIRMESKNPLAAIMLPVLLKEWLKELNLLPNRKEYTKSTLLLFGFIKQDAEEFFKKEGNEAIKEIETKFYCEILEYLNRLRESFPTHELLLLTICKIYAKKLQDIARAITVLSYIRTLNLSFAAENAASELAVTIQKVATRNVDRESNQLYEDHFKNNTKAAILKKNIQKIIVEQIAFWKVLADMTINIFQAIKKAQSISVMTRQIQNSWQAHFQGYKMSNFELTVNYGHYLDIVQGLNFDGYTLIKNTYQMKHNRMHAKGGEDDESKATAILIVSIEPDKQGKILNICTNANSFFGVRRGQGLIGMNMNSVIPKAFQAKHNELMSKLYSSSNLNMSQHPATYIRTIDGQYFKAEVNVQLNCAMDQGLSFLISVKRLSENESILIVDCNNRVIEYSSDLGENLSLVSSRNYSNIIIGNLCPEFNKLNLAVQTTGELTTPKHRKYRGNSQHYMQATRFTSQENLISKNFDPMSPGREEDTKFLSQRTEDDGGLMSPLRSVPYSLGEEEFKTTTMIQSRWEPRTMRFTNISQNDQRNEKRSFEFMVDIEGVFVCEDTFFRVLKLQTPMKTTERRPQVVIQSVKSVIQDEFADEFPYDYERNESFEKNLQLVYTKEDPALTSPRPTVFVPVKPLFYSQNSQEKQSVVNSGRDSARNNKEHIVVPLQLSEGKKNKTESITSSRLTAKVLAKNLTNLFREDRVNRLPKITINIIFLTLIIVILTATIDYVSTKNSLNSMQNAVNLVDLINKRLYKAVYAWQTVLFLLTSSTSSSSSGGGGGGGGWGGGPGGSSSGINSGLQDSVETAAEDVIDNNNELQKEVINSDDTAIIEALYEKNIVMYDPEDHSKSVFDSFRANEILAQDNIFIANYEGTVAELKEEPSTLSAANNTANSYLIEVGNSITDVTDYFTRTKKKNVHTLTVIYCLKDLAILMPFLFICKLFQNIVSAYKRLFKFVAKVPQVTLLKRIQQLESLQAFFAAESSLIFDNATSKSMLNFSFSKGKATDTKSHARAKSYRFRELVIYMLKYLFLAFILILPALAVFTYSYKTFEAAFSDLDTINTKMVTSYQLGTQVSMILPSYYFLKNFGDDDTYLIKNISPLEQFYSSIADLNDANEVLVKQVLTSAVDDDYVYNMLNEDICDYVNSDSQSSCTSVTSSNSQIGLLDVNTMYYQSASQAIQDYVDGVTTSESLDPYSLSLKDIYQTLAEHFLDLFKRAIYMNLSDDSYHLTINVLVIVLSTILIRIFVLTKYKEVDIAIRKILRLIPYQIIEDNKIFMHYLKREFKDELNGVPGFRSK